MKRATTSATGARRATSAWARARTASHTLQAAAGDGGTSGCPPAISSARLGRVSRRRVPRRLTRGARWANSFSSTCACARAAPLVEGGLIRREAGRVLLSERGLELADSIFAEFV